MKVYRFSLFKILITLFLTSVVSAGELDGFLPIWQSHITENIFSYKPLEYAGCDIDPEYGRVFVANKNGELISLISDTGEIEWRFSVRDPIHRRPLYSKNILYAATTGGEIIALDVSKKRPAVLWNKKVHGGIISEITENEDRLFLLTERNTLYSINKKDGNIIYQINNDLTDGFTVYTDTPILVINDKIIYTLSTGQLFVLNRDDGKLIYKMEIFNSDEKIDGFTGLNIFNGHIIISTLAGELYKIELLSGKTLWSRSLSQISTMKTIKDNGDIFVFHTDGTIALYDNNGSLICKKMPLKRRIIGADLIGKRLIVRYLDGDIISFSKEDLTLTSYIRLSAPVFSSVTSDEKYAYIFSSKGNLIKFIIK